MKLMEQKILTEGQVLPGNILKVGSFLNQQLDIEFLHEVGKEIARLYKNTGVTKVITIEASGIPLATLAALELGVPAVIVKKHASANLSHDVYSAEIASFTHKNTYTAVVAKEYLNKNDSVLIVDDFLAVGNAIRGLQKILNDAGATLAGCAIAIEKGFQHGGDELRAEGIRVESLAIVDEMKDGEITFRP
ncbi:MAG: xanthine phosphoribosyltransferase [Clostridia bacterium]|nr:xanthine phosphoribosyltransferase [Clostridia bacterium]